MGDYEAFIADLRTWSEDKHPRGEKGSATGGQFVKGGSGGSSSSTSKPAAKSSSKAPAKAAHKAVHKKQSGGHEKSSADHIHTLPAAKQRIHSLEAEVKHLQSQLHAHTAAGKKAAAKHPSHPPLTAGGKNNPKRVKELQGLLKQLGIGKVHVNGEFGHSTEAAIKDVQKRLGMSPTGHASETLINKIRAAKALSPCIKGGSGKRAEEIEAEERSLLHVLVNGICQMCEGEE